VRYINLRSFVNRWHNRFERKRKRTFLGSKPIEMGIEPTNNCNSKCIMCNRMFSRADENLYTGRLSWDTLRKCQEFIRYCERVCFGGFGEPFLHLEYLQMAKFIKECGPYVYCFTNGSLLGEKECQGLVDVSFDEICVSLGGGDRQTHHFIRGVDNFDRVVESLRRINEIKSRRGVAKPFISFNIVAMKTVLEKMDKVLDLAVELGVKTIAMPNLVAQGEAMIEESPWMHVEWSQDVFRKAEEVTRAHGIEFGYPDLTEGKGDCDSLFTTMIVAWDGIVLSCALERFVIGDLKKSSLEEIWNSEEYRRLRERYYNEGIARVCPNCSCWNRRKEAFLSPSENTRRKALGKECESHVAE
jgi:MoaA/NifB/PqqE/SkfB family radical SAM enzyme